MHLDGLYAQEVSRVLNVHSAVGTCKDVVMLPFIALVGYGGVFFPVCVDHVQAPHLSYHVDYLCSAVVSTASAPYWCIH